MLVHFIDWRLLASQTIEIGVQALIAGLICWGLYQLYKML